MTRTGSGTKGQPQSVELAVEASYVFAIAREAERLVEQRNEEIERAVRPAINQEMREDEWNNCEDRIITRIDVHG